MSEAIPSAGCGTFRPTVSFTKKTTALCRRCAGETKQIVRGGRSVALSASIEEVDSAGTHTREFQTEVSYELFECCSCEYIDLRPSADVSGMSGIAVTFHPQRSSRHVPQWRNELPRMFSPLLDEVYRALNSECRILALMGARSVIDLILDEKVGDVVTFKGRLQAFENLGFVSSRQREVLWNAFVGSSSSSRPMAPTLETLNRVMDAMEEILHAVYVHRTEAPQTAAALSRDAITEGAAPSLRPALRRR